MFSRPKILFLVSLLFVALLNPKFNPYLLFKFLIFYHSSNNHMIVYLLVFCLVGDSLWTDCCRQRAVLQCLALSQMKKICSALPGVLEMAWHIFVHM